MSSNPLEEAQLLIDTFADRNGEDESNLRDILADLMIWAEQNGRKFGDELTQALHTWLAESPSANDAVLQAWATAGPPFPEPHHEHYAAVKAAYDMLPAGLPLDRDVPHGAALSNLEREAQTVADPESNAEQEQMLLEERIAQILDAAQDNAIAELSDDEYGPDRLFHEEDLMRLGRQIGRLLTAQLPQPNVDDTVAELIVEEWFLTGELSSDLERIGVTSSEILTGMGALLDRANTCEIPGDVLFRATNGKLYTIHVEAEIVEVASDDEWALETIAAVRVAEQEAVGDLTAEQLPTWLDRHSVDCADCGKLADERDCLPNSAGEGEVCVECLDKRDEADRTQIIAAARAQYAHEGSIEIDQGAAFSRGEENGLYVAAWVWLPWPISEQSVDSVDEDEESKEDE